MPRKLTPRSSLDNLKREAKRWLKALRANVADARSRLERALPDAPHAPTLRHVQLALARELGFPGWTALKERLVAGAPPHDAPDSLVARFLDNACPDHHVRGGPDHVRAAHTAMRLLARHPDIAHASFYTAVVCGDLQRVRAMLTAHPELATGKDAVPSVERSDVGGSGDLYHRELGPKGWEPLLYLCFTRLPLPAVSENAVAIARELLDHGASPNAYFMAGDSRYTPLVGAIGEGEENRPPHPQRDALVRLLLDRGADPYDMQVVYDIHFHGEVLWFLELVYEHAGRLDGKWNDPNWSMLDMGRYGSGARWHLGIAVDHDDLALAEWCLTHGASPNAAPPRHQRLPQGTLYEEAVIRGHLDLAELLVRHGAVRSEVRLKGIAAFVAACRRLDRAEVQAQLARHPEYLQAPEPLLDAAKHDRADVTAFLLDLGMSPDVRNAAGERPLHHAAYNGSLAVAQLLIDGGAEIDPVEANWHNTPLGAAVYAQYAPMIDLLSRYSRDVWELTYAGKVERLQEVLADQPELARVRAGSTTPLMWLPPQDEALAMQAAQLLIAHGADPAVRDDKNMTAADRAERLEMVDLAAMLRSAESAAQHPEALEPYEQMARNLLDAYRTGTPAAMERHWNDSWHRRRWPVMRRYVQLDLGLRPESEEGGSPAPGAPSIDITLDDARALVAREQGFESWRALAEHAASLPSDSAPVAAKRVKVLFQPSGAEASPAARTRDWDAALEALADPHAVGVDANGQMTDETLERVSRLEHLTTLHLSGSPITDEGLRHLARMPQLREVSLSGCRITDAGAAHLAACEQLERVDLSMTATGDGALRALAGKARLRHLRSGTRVTDDGIPLLHRYPVFKAWQGGDVSLALLSPDAEPNSLTLRGSFTDRGLAHIVGLDGLFALNVHDTTLAITAAGLAPLVALPQLGFLAFHATDDAMPYIAAMPRLRFLMCQDTVAGDDGFAALSRSQSIEYIWGRRCHNLRRRGFSALADMPALRALAVSCKNVDDIGLSALPRFRALRELMPMDVPDEGFRHVGRCAQLESLILMYCRDTTDAATEHIVELTRLTRYCATYTRITDRTLEMLSRMPSLERIELAGCPGVTDAGIAALARLPRLRALGLAGMQNVTASSVSAFAPGVLVDYSP